MESTSQLELSVDNVARQFERRTIFAGISFALHGGQIVGITGRNGSGKTTLMKIIAGVLAPSSGTIKLSIGKQTVQTDEYYRKIGYVSPYLSLYEEFSPIEHMKISARLRGIPFDEDHTHSLLTILQLHHRRKDRISSFSSGMKQRMKYVLALQHSPALLLVDEPMTNLDYEGIAIVEHILANHRQAMGGIIMATNDQRDIILCDTVVPVVRESNDL